MPQGRTNALAVIAIAESGNFLHAPDVYMDKIACGPRAVGSIDLDKTPTENLRSVADKLEKKVEDVTVVILDRPRHEDLIQEVREAGARIWLIGDGDVSSAIATCFRDTGVDLIMGVGGAPEGVIGAAALRCMGGDFQGRLQFPSDAQRERAKKMGVTDLDRKYGIDDLASGNVMFCATGVTNGTFLKGVKFTGNGASTHSIVMRSETGTVRFIEANHRFDRKPRY